MYSAYVDGVVILVTLNGENMSFFGTNTPCGGSTEKTVKFYALGVGSPYKKVRVYALIGGSPRENV